MRPQKRLLRPLAYLSVEHKGKRRYDFGLPILLGVFSTGVIYLLGDDVPLVGDHSIVGIVTDLLVVLTGFYVASLAAVATFNNGTMDDVMDGDPPTLDVQWRGTTETIELTRRRFLSLLFGYLAFLSLLLYLVGAFAGLVAPELLQALPNPVRVPVRWLSLLIYLVAAANLMVTTLLGLYYMSDRIHWPDQKPHVREPQDPGAAATDNE